MCTMQSSDKTPQHDCNYVTFWKGKNLSRQLKDWQLSSIVQDIGLNKKSTEEF